MIFTHKWNHSYETLQYLHIVIVIALMSKTHDDASDWSRVVTYYTVKYLTNFI